MPLLYNKNIEDIYKMMEHLNGVLFCGGVCDFDMEYYNFAKAVYQRAKKMNDEGNYFPLWGTCMGFQEFAQFEAGRDAVGNYTYFEISLPLKFIVNPMETRLYSHFGVSV